MTQINGIDIRIHVNTRDADASWEPQKWRVVAGQKNATLNRSSSTMDITSKDSGGWMNSVAAPFKEWSIDCDGLYVIDDEGYAALEKSFMDGTKVMVEIKAATDFYYRGEALVTDLPIEASSTEVATYSVTLQGCGALLKTPLVETP